MQCDFLWLTLRRCAVASVTVIAEPISAAVSFIAVRDGQFIGFILRRSALQMRMACCTVSVQLTHSLVVLFGCVATACSRSHLALHDELVSKAFQGRHGRAYLFGNVFVLPSNAATSPRCAHLCCLCVALTSHLCACAHFCSCPLQHQRDIRPEGGSRADDRPAHRVRHLLHDVRGKHRYDE